MQGIILLRYSPNKLCQCIYLPWLPWAMHHKAEPTLFVSCCPRKPREVVGQHRIAIQPQQTSPMYVLALAALGNAAQSRTNHISVMLPKEVKASRGGNIAWQYCMAIQPIQTLPKYVLALAALGDATQNRTNSLCVMLPKEAMASRGGNITSQYSPQKLLQCMYLPWPPWAM
jgi:hypothetical protein